MKSLPPKPSLYAVPGGVLSLSGPALQEFLQAVLAKGAAFRFRTRGFSMHPFIKDRDVVTVSPWAGSTLRPGEVVAFCHPETCRLVVHRILACTSQGYFLKGDNSHEMDGLIPFISILGRVTRVERNGRVLRLGLGPEGRLLALLSQHQLLQPLLQWFVGWLRPFLIKRSL